MTERIVQGAEDPAEAVARRAAWAARVPDVVPLNAEELYDILETKGILVEGDRPRPKLASPR